MNSRFLITVLCLGAVAFACGPRARNESSSKKGSTTMAAAYAAVKQQGAARSTATSVKGAVEAQVSARATPQGVQLGLHVVNTSRKRIELTFPSGQTHDFVILDSAGAVVWRWAAGRMFTQALQNKLLSGGETLDMQASWETPTLPPGRYVARAVLTSQNYPLTQQTEFRVHGNAVASR